MGLLTSTKSMSYDHPAYTSIAQRDIPAITAGSGAAGQKFIAFTAKILKSVTLRTITAGTGTDSISLIGVSGTTTTTYTVGVLSTSAATSTSSFNLANANAGVYPQMNQGDEYYVVNGTDATIVWAGAIEEVIQPLATVAE